MAKQVALTLEEAWRRLADSVPHWQPSIESVATQDASGRVLATDVTARADSPPADNSAMDGFAFAAKDVALNQPVAVSQRIAAGSTPLPLAPRTAARIFTGAETPDGADCVVIQENCDYTETHVTVKQGLKAGANIRRRGDDIKQGDVVAQAGLTLRPQHVGFLLSAGVGQVEVYARLRVGVIATGDELVDVDTRSTSNDSDGTPAAGKIFESNSPMIAARLSDLGCLPTRYRARDTHEDTVRALTQALAENDAVLTIGGVSVGEEDHVQAALKEVGQIEFWKINIKPGKPFLLGSANGKPVMGLPGNPVSSFVTFTLFCAPFFEALKGGGFLKPRKLPALAGFASSKVSDRVDHLRGQIISTYPELIVKPIGRQHSSIQGALCLADVLIVIPANAPVVEGQTLEVILL